MGQPCMPPRHDPMLEVERIFMVGFASTHARAKEEAPTASHEGGQDGATENGTLSASLSLPADRVDNMYCQMLEIHTIATAQLVECTRWLQSDSTSSPF
jgi:hypothetical protein